MTFDWDAGKDASNQAKHGVSFDEAKLVFADPLHVSLLDHRFSYFEERWITIGETPYGRLLVVANLYFDSNGQEVIRIISAREASQNERKHYERI
ncbi:MAG: BrnT family toxin [Spirochaetales bacterium]